MSESLQHTILHSLDTHGSISDTRTLSIPGSTAQATDADAQISILGALNSLLSREMIHYESHETLSHALTPEGVQISQQGSHEARVWAALPAKGAGSPVPPAELKKIIGDEAAKVGQGRAFKNGWIAKDSNGLVKAVSSIEDTTQKDLREIESTGTLTTGEKSLADLRKRKLAVQKFGTFSSLFFHFRG